MQFHATPIPQLYVIELDQHVDSRGFFARAWCEREFAEHGLTADCSQANLSYNTRRGTLRGMHFQLPPHAEAKLVRAVHGTVQDVALDLRPDSPTFGRWYAAELSSENRRALFIPEGCAHGYLTLTDHAEVLYLVSTPYHPQASRGIRWCADVLHGAWPFEPLVLSEQDSRWPTTIESLDWDAAARTVA